MTLPSQALTNVVRDNIELADPGYCTPSQVQVILGAGICASLLNETPPVRQCDGSIALSSSLGWIIFGPIRASADPLVVTAVAVNDAVSLSLDDLLQRFWDCEDMHGPRRLSADELWCEHHFSRTHYRDKAGRYVVRIPLKQNASLLGSTREVARKRFLQLERRMSCDADMRDKYVGFMRELVQLGHMRMCDRAPNEAIAYYIPHHCVNKKFRVVFDASCKSDTGVSLNDIQHAGARLQDDLSQIILRFRTFPVALTADVVKMFRQVKIDESDWDLQRIYWRESPQDPLKEYWITVVIYGETSSSFNAVRAMQQVGRDNTGTYPEAANAICNHFYMDDLLTGAQNASAAKDLRYQITASLRTGGFELDKWASNCSSDETRSLGQTVVNICADEASVLGLSWRPKLDVLNFKVQQIETPAVITKREVVSAVAKLFDPVGLLAPVIVRGKCLIQDLWRTGVTWDEPLPEEFAQRWIEYNCTLQAVQKIAVPRWLSTTDVIQLHGFADASSIAFGAVIYIRVSSPDGTVACSVLSCKTRVAPVKTISIPRLELCAAELLGRHMQYIRQVFHAPDIRSTFWTDSEIVLCWIRKLPCSLKTFVANRVASIQDATAGAEWRHVASRDNPADIASRGASAAELCSSRLWWTGPDWLLQPESDWPPMKRFTSPSDKEAVQLEIKPVVAVIATLEQLSVENETILQRRSTLGCILRITAFVMRFTRNARAMLPARQIGPPSPTECDDALLYWVQRSQSTDFGQEIRALNRGECISSGSVLKTLVPFIGAAKVLRLGGRLQNSLLPYNAQHPIILTGNCRLAELLIREAHFRTLHGGVQICMAYLRQRFWIINLRRAVKACVNKCVTCVRQRHQTAEQLMGNLPACRTQQGRAFKSSGVDYAGPITLKAKTGRGSRTTTKGYIALFVCLVTRAIHLEAVSDLTVVAFMAAFRRFVSRRGHCALLMSDNATTFVGADNFMRRVSEMWDGQLLAEQIAAAGTEWRYITPSAPHQGGIWEAGVKSTKHHLRRVMGSQVFTFETLATVLAQIEACLNSRPLTALSDDPSDMSALTPGHFLVGEPLVQPFARDLTDVPVNRLKLWSIVQRTTQEFWRRWQEEYLSTLQQRQKWYRAEPNIIHGDMVIIKNENLPPAMWPLGRVIDMHIGADGLTRSCTVRTATTELKRPVQKLCLLPVRAQESVEAHSSNGGSVAD